MKAQWPIFFAVLLAPAILTILLVSTGMRQGDAPANFVLIGGGAAGIICGAMLGLQLGKTPAAKLGIGILFAGVMAVVCIGLSCFGCLASGFQLNLH
jgi:hypothetical protein